MKYLSYEHKKFLANHYVFDAWQFIINAAKGVATTIFCCETVKQLIKQSNEEYIKWQNDMFKKLNEDFKLNGNAHIGISYNDMPKDEVDYLGEQRSRPFLVDKYIKDFFQYARNAFDSLAQVTNVALLANQAIDIERVDFANMYRQLIKVGNSGIFPDTEAFFIRIIKSDEYRYLSEFNNRTKHICDSKLILSHSLLDDHSTSQISAFYKKGQQFRQENILDIIDIICEYVNKEFTEFLKVITNDIKRDKYVDGRIHSLSFYSQQIKSDPKSTFSVVYINVETSMDELPHEIRILLIKDDSDDIMVSNCEYENILVRNSEEKYVGKYKLNEIIVDDTLHRYLKYVKVDCDPLIAFIEETRKSTVIKTGFMSGKYIWIDD